MDANLFACTRCGHVDMHDLARSEVERVRQERQFVEVNVDQTPEPAPRYEPNVCTRCLTGYWHDQFPYLPYQPGADRVSNPV